MRKIVFLILIAFCVIPLTNINIVNAQNHPKGIVSSFGEALSSWCSTNDIIYREKIDELCSGARKCRVEDKIHAEYQKGKGLTNYETFVLDSYMNMFQSLMSKSVNYQMSNVKVVGSDEMPDGTLTFITADIKVSGALNHTVTDLFLVRNNKITGIYSYSSDLGFSHLNGSLIKALQIGRYSWASHFQNGYAQVANEAGKCGLIDTKGEVIVPCIWEAVNYSGGDFAWGFNYTKDNPDKDVTYDLRNGGKRTPLYRVQDFMVGREKVVTTFSEGYAVAYNEERKYGYLNDSTYTVQYLFDDATRFCDGYAYVEYAEAGMIIDKNFTPILTDTKTYKICGNFYDGLAKVKDRNSGKYGFINKKGKLVIPCTYNQAGYFSEGLCSVALGDNILTAKYGLANTQGEIVIPIIYDGFWGAFENGYIEARKGVHGTLLGMDGKPLPGFSWEYDEIRRIHEGYARFKKNGKYGFLNANGEVVIPPIYDGATFFVGGIACVSKVINGKHKYGGINMNGTQVIPYIYDETFYFSDGIALVEKDNRIGLIDVYGNSTFLPKRQK